MAVTFEGILNQFDSNLWGHHMMVPTEIVHGFKENNVNRLVCTIDSEIKFHCAFMPSGNGAYFINVNKEIRKKLRWRIGQPRSIELEADTSKYGMEMPEELEVLLATDNYGDKLFHALTPGKQRNLIYIAAKPKQSSTRLKKSIIMIDYLKEVDGKLDFKELNQSLKDRKDEEFE